MRLLDLVDWVLLVSTEEDWGLRANPLSREFILRTIDFKGPLNQHLANPLNRYLNSPIKPVGAAHYFRPREVPLTGEEWIQGEYLVFDYCGHDERTLLREFVALEDLRKSILDAGGIANIFTSGLVAIIGGRVARFSVTYQDATGRRIVFDKGRQYVQGGEEPSLEVLDLDWL